MSTVRRPPDEALLSHAGFVRSLARSLVADPHLAEDVAQDAFVAALARPPGRPAQLRAWLGAVTRDLVRRRWRGEARRARREAAVAREDRSPAAVAVAARLETERRLVQAVSSLEEPGRSAVVLRYYDGLGPTAIARRLDVPVRTVESRLRRALATLRARLDDESDGDRRAWALALLPGAGAATSTATTAASTSGVLIMSTTTKVGLGALALLLASAVAWRLATPPMEPGADTPRESPVSSPVDPSTPATGPAEADESADAPEPARDARSHDTAACHGRVMVEGGAPLAGAVIRIHGKRGPRTRTDADGAFRLDGIGIGRVPPTLVLGPPERHLHLGVLALAPGEDREVEFTVPRGSSLEVRTQGPDGLPAGSVRVSLVPARGEDARSAGGRTDDEGRLRLDRLSPARYRVVVDDPRYRAWRGAVDLTGGSPAGPLAIDLLAAARLVVRFRSWPAALKANVNLMLVPAAGAASSTGPFAHNDVVTPEGILDVPAPPPGRFVAYVTLAGNLLPQQTIRVSAEGSVEILLDAPAGETVRGRVVAADGRPVESGSITLQARPPGAGSRGAPLEADGAFVVPFLASGAHGISVGVGGQTLVGFQDDVDVRAGGVDGLVVRLPEGGGIDGRVVGFPTTLVGSLLRSVTLRRREPDGWQERGSIDVSYHGSFRARHLPAGRWQLQVEPALLGGGGRSEPVEVEVRAGEVTADVVIRRAAMPRLELRLRTASDEPYRERLVVFADPIGGGSQRPLVLEPDDDGRCVIESLPAGRWTITLFGGPEGFTKREVEVMDRPGETITLRLW